MEKKTTLLGTSSRQSTGVMVRFLKCPGQTKAPNPFLLVYIIYTIIYAQNTRQDEEGIWVYMMDGSRLIWRVRFDLIWFIFLPSLIFIFCSR